MTNRIVRGAIIGFVAATLTMSLPLLIDPLEKRPESIDDYLKYGAMILIWSAMIGFVIGVPVGAIFGLFFKKPRQDASPEDDDAPPKYPDWINKATPK